MARELEAKFVVASLDALRGVLRGLGASLKKTCRFERNIVFDTSGRDLKARGELLRLRQSDRAVLTWKRPMDGPVPAGVKAMEEVETTVGDFATMAEVLRGLGYKEALWYEKCREQWVLGKALVCLDLLPFGEFIEIEGDPTVIAETAARLGLSMDKASALTYHDLYRAYLAENGLPPQDSFTFSQEQRAGLGDVCFKAGDA